MRLAILGIVLLSTLLAAQDKNTRTTLSQRESANLLVTRVPPNYPPLARQARIQGQVILQAEISKEGTIKSLQLISGHPMLAPAAIEAVKQWIYTPYHLNGQPVDVETQVVVNFSLSDRGALPNSTASAVEANANAATSQTGDASDRVRLTGDEARASNRSAQSSAGNGMAQPSSSQQPTFKGHRIGETTAEFLSVEPSLKAKLVECQATAPRDLTPEEIRKRYGRKVEAQAEKKHQSLLDKDPDVYGDKCGALLDTLVNGNGHLYGNGHDPINPYADNLRRRSFSDPWGHPLPQLEVSDGREFYFDNGALSALHLDIAADYGSVRDDVTSRLGVGPKEVTLPYQNAFGATWRDIAATWDTNELRVELFQAGNPAKPSLPRLSVRSQAVYKKVLEREKLEPKPLD